MVTAAVALARDDVAAGLWALAVIVTVLPEGAWLGGM
jgi:hypothetical protein